MSVVDESVIDELDKIIDRVISRHHRRRKRRQKFAVSVPWILRPSP